MKHSPAEIIVADLIHNEIGTDYRNGNRWACYVDMAPSPEPQIKVPKEIITVYNTTGIIDGRYQTDKHGVDRKTVEHPGLQVIVRSVNPIDGYRKCIEVSDRFDAILRNEVVVSDDKDYVIQAINRTTNVAIIGEDPMTRLTNHSVNAIITYRLQEYT